MSETERALIDVSAGSVDALGKLYDEYGARAYRVARAVCGDDGQAQEAVQDAFMSIWRNARTYRGTRGTVAAWLLAVVHHGAVDIARRDGRHAKQRTSEDQLDTVRAPGDAREGIIQRDHARQLRTALARLPDVQREVITLACFGELTHTEIAAQLDLPAGTVKGRMRLGLHKLRADLNRAMPDASARR